MKIERRIQKLLKQQQQQQAASSDSQDDKGDLAARLGKARADLDYIVHFPPGEKYVSLLKDPEEEEAREKVRSAVSNSIVCISFIFIPRLSLHNVSKLP